MFHVKRLGTPLERGMRLVETFHVKPVQAKNVAERFTGVPVRLRIA